ncbi:MAG: PLP-dependent cysteine synthase family protein [Candidatus Geothermarchaeales archaeon]
MSSFASHRIDTPLSKIEDRKLNVYDSAIELLGNTPLLYLNRINPYKTPVAAKLEWYNPWGSIKDRIAYHMLKREEELGTLGRGEKKLIEATSGNTGIGLAAVANILGYNLEISITEEINKETEKMLELLGARVEKIPSEFFCPSATGVGPISFARSMAMKNRGYFMLDQYKSGFNPETHYLTTGPEIWRQTKGKVTHLVVGIGTGGTIVGVGKYLKEKSKEIKVIGVQQPKDEDIYGLRNLEAWTPEVYDPSVVDEVREVSLKDAMDALRELARKEALLVGPSSGANAHESLQVAKEVDGGLIVTIFPDRVEKYLSILR